MNNRYMDDVVDGKSEVLAELISLMAKTARAEEIKKEDTDAVAADAFNALQAAIRSDKKLLMAFQTLQNKFNTDDNFRAATNSLFVEAVEMLDLNVTADKGSCDE